MVAGSGRISVLVSKDMGALLGALRGLEPAVRARIRRHTRDEAMPIWQEEVRGRASTRIQTRVLSDSARVSVSDVNVMLKSATIGKTHGVPNSVLASGAEFGASPSTRIAQRSSKGKPYTRRMGPVFLPPRRNGYVVFDAVRSVIPRLGSLWAQIAYRTNAEELEKVMH